MHEPILKSHWERYRDHVELDVHTAQTLLRPHTSSAIINISVLTNGCANSNFKITLEDGSHVVLRIYLREASALKRERAIHQLVNQLIPVADFLYTDDSCETYPHPYAIIDWIDGILFRELIFSKDESAISECAADAGRYLGYLRTLKLPYGGFFQDDMQIRPFADDELFEPYLMRMLQDETVASSLGRNLQQDVQSLVSQCCHLLPVENDANLTHADYDPANMLVKTVNGRWQISAILDWEFAFAGTYLLDIGMMLRYNHKIPSYFTNSFVAGIEEVGPKLPADWMKQAKLMDLICLLQLLHYNSPADRPYLNRDVVQLVQHTVKTFTTL